ncbi:MULTISPECIES: CPCC family cysteine-rich protein [unclassified Bradyrhizobium]|uniref:CPCC family cysteine-rich protein n=1 Tax=Bradyrhizobium TaxID=374 RepID=UPI0028E2E4BE|nr:MULTISPECIES: CPCC family cysteine-rich protein [unclassified Bradyrhizobium]
MGERGGFEICPVCYWEDDGQDDHDADLVRGGPNGALSLTEARANFKTLGASEAAHRACVRLPRRTADGER